MKVVIIIFAICFLILSIYWLILYLSISQNYLKNIFERLSTDPRVNPRWFPALSLIEYPDDIITKNRFIAQLGAFALLRNFKSKKKTELYKVITSILTTEELNILSLQMKIALIAFGLIIIGVLLNWLFLS